MTLKDLIQLAAEKKGSLGALAKAMGKHQNRLTEWKKGERQPDAHEIAFLADCAGLPVLETVADIESRLDSRFASIWTAALGKLKAAGVAASTVVAVTLTSSQIEPVHAAPLDDSMPSVCILCLLILGLGYHGASASVNRLWGWVKNATQQPIFSQC